MADASELEKDRDYWRDLFRTTIKQDTERLNEIEQTALREQARADLAERERDELRAEVERLQGLGVGTVMLCAACKLPKQVRKGCNCERDLLSRQFERAKQELREFAKDQSTYWGQRSEVALADIEAMGK